MKSLMSLVLAVVFTSTFFTQNASADVTGGKSSKYIEVTVSKSDPDHRRFRLCSTKTNECELLGYKEYYSVQELRDQRVVEQWQLVASIAGTAVILYYASYVSANVTAAIAGEGVLVGLGVLGSASLVSGLISLTKLGPPMQAKQQYVLRNAIVNDTDVHLKNYKTNHIEKVADRLDMLLHKI